jgi:hypothetical protein
VSLCQLLSYVDDALCSTWWKTNIWQYCYPPTCSCAYWRACEAYYFPCVMFERREGLWPFNHFLQSFLNGIRD